MNVEIVIASIDCITIIDSLRSLGHKQESLILLSCGNEVKYHFKFHVAFCHCSKGDLGGLDSEQSGAYGWISEVV